MRKLGREQKLKLRWCFEYHDGRKKYGAWDCHKKGDSSTMASKQNLTDCKLVYIQFFDIKTQEIYDFAPLPIAKFKEFKWIAGVEYSGSNVSGGDIIGLKLISISGDGAEAYIDGIYKLSGHESVDSTINQFRKSEV